VPAASALTWFLQALGVPGHHAMGEVGRACRRWQRALALFTRLGTPEAEEVRALLNGE
jgi:hypothetical protein